MAKKPPPEERKEPSKELLQLGERIRALRLKKGFKSYESFANSHNMNRVQWGRYEKGENLKFENLVKVATALGYTLKDFFSEGFD